MMATVSKWYFFTVTTTVNMWWTTKQSNNEEDLANIEKKTESLFDILFTAPAALLNVNQHFVLSSLEGQVR